MTDVKQVAVVRAIALLNAANCQFKVIDASGNEYGALEVVKPQGRRKKVHDLHPVYKPHLETLEVGGCVTIEHHEPERLRAAMAAYAGKSWGTGSAISTVSGNKVELLRVS